MISRSAVLVCACLVGVTAAESPDRIHLLRAGSLDNAMIGLQIGLSAPISKAEVDGIAGTPAVTRFDQDIEARWRAGLHLGLTCDWQHSRWSLDDEAKYGWGLGGEFAYDGHRGEITDVTNSVGGQPRASGAIQLDAWSLALAPAGFARWYVGASPRSTLRAIQLRCTPIIGIGTGRARTDPGGQWSDFGLYLKYGGRLSLLAELGEYALVGVYGGWEGAWTQVHWRNAHTATIRAGGPVASLVFAQRW